MPECTNGVGDNSFPSIAPTPERVREPVADKIHLPCLAREPTQLLISSEVCLHSNGIQRHSLGDEFLLLILQRVPR